MELPEDSLHVWRIDVRRPGEGLREVLSPDETERASRFRFDRDRDAFVCTRGALRTLLGAYLGAAPEDVELAYGEKGKPEVPTLSFNVSHAGDVAVAAFARTGRVGVDVELMRDDVELIPLARRFFTPAENEALGRLPDDELVAGFYSCWTRKEAFVKALGEGLSFELDRVDVSVHPERARVLSIDGDTSAGERWSMVSLDPGRGCAGAVAVDRPAVDVTVLEWPSPVAA
ncbi:MAG: 4'-phosphopantetheinyl transferase superfamily protein [Actinomycetota bacterium]|nr:4'-phosphopantetheinyl transferase superfamily protein [Actinomycetota bacterium]